MNKMIPVILAFNNFIYLFSSGKIHSIVSIYKIQKLINFCLGKSKHVFKGWVQCKKCSNIITRGEIINSNGQYTGDEEICDRPGLSSIFKNFKKTPEKTFS